MMAVGILLVSHSEKVAEGVKDLIHQVVGDLPIEAAGGTDEGELGTSFEKIQTALEKVTEKAESTIVFYDLGSARMNAEMAIEITESDQIKLVSHPILEGAYLAAVEASIDKSLEEILESLEKEFGKS
ncbi:PTS-dependent dihydroxyacetone kinase phosphotransferase subunit DhaM [Halobacillus litoralis]|uniref:phosphoenolpyruvate--glycerone phosphotransferase n=2 Tax=Halobacillus litoralis TaxID=45668 RepID=A0A845DT83_9BACI|nr:PTS-dependent dihydroxyacetone kinase phosphotransferase subunit DhaM [Halobacillus litoralis]